jgi:DNA-binding Xre family transcriptional regulator
MSLAVAIQEVLKIRGMTRRELLARLPRQSSRWAVYRILASKSADARLSTILMICAALEVSPTELFQLAGFVPRVERSTALLDVRLRKSFAGVQGLSQETKDLAIQEIEAVVAVLQTWDAAGRASAEGTVPVAPVRATRGRKPGVKPAAAMAAEAGA